MYGTKCRGNRKQRIHTASDRVLRQTQLHTHNFKPSTCSLVVSPSVIQFIHTHNECRCRCVVCCMGFLARTCGALAHRQGHYIHNTCKSQNTPSTRHRAPNMQQYIRRSTVCAVCSSHRKHRTAATFCRSGQSVSSAHWKASYAN